MVGPEDFGMLGRIGDPSETTEGQLFAKTRISPTANAMGLVGSTIDPLTRRDTVPTNLFPNMNPTATIRGGNTLTPWLQMLGQAGTPPPSWEISDPSGGGRSLQLGRGSLGAGFTQNLGQNVTAGSWKSTAAGMDSAISLDGIDLSDDSTWVKDQAQTDRLTGTDKKIPTAAIGKVNDQGQLNSPHMSQNEIDFLKKQQGNQFGKDGSDVIVVRNSAGKTTKTTQSGLDASKVLINEVAPLGIGQHRVTKRTVDERGNYRYIPGYIGANQTTQATDFGAYEPGFEEVDSYFLSPDRASLATLRGAGQQAVPEFGMDAVAGPGVIDPWATTAAPADEQFNAYIQGPSSLGSLGQFTGEPGIDGPMAAAAPAAAPAAASVATNYGIPLTQNPNLVGGPMSTIIPGVASAASGVASVSQPLQKLPEENGGEVEEVVSVNQEPIQETQTTQEGGSGIEGVTAEELERFKAYRAAGGQVNDPLGWKLQGFPRPESVGARGGGTMNDFESLMKKIDDLPDPLVIKLGDKTNNPKSIRQFEQRLGRSLNDSERGQVTLHLQELDRLMGLTRGDSSAGEIAPTQQGNQNQLLASGQTGQQRMGQQQFVQQPVRQQQFSQQPFQQQQQGASSGRMLPTVTGAASVPGAYNVGIPAARPLPLWEEDLDPYPSFRRFRMEQFPGLSLAGLKQAGQALDWGFDPAYGRFLLNQIATGIPGAVAGVAPGGVGVTGMPQVPTSGAPVLDPATIAGVASGAITGDALGAGGYEPLGVGSLFRQYLGTGQRRPLGDIRGTYAGLGDYLRASAGVGSGSIGADLTDIDPRYEMYLGGMDAGQLQDSILGMTQAALGVRPGMSGYVQSGLGSMYDRRSQLYGPQGASRFADWVSSAYQQPSYTPYTPTRYQQGIGTQLAQVGSPYSVDPNVMAANINRQQADAISNAQASGSLNQGDWNRFNFEDGVNKFAFNPELDMIGGPPMPPVSR